MDLRISLSSQHSGQEHHTNTTINTKLDSPSKKTYIYIYTHPYIYICYYYRNINLTLFLTVSLCTYTCNICAYEWMRACMPACLHVLMRNIRACLYECMHSCMPAYLYVCLRWFVALWVHLPHSMYECVLVIWDSKNPSLRVPAIFIFPLLSWEQTQKIKKLQVWG